MLAHPRARSALHAHVADLMPFRLHLCGDSSQRPPLSLQGDHLPNSLLLGVMRTAEMPLRSVSFSRASPWHVFSLPRRRLLIGTEETSNYASVDAAFRPIADKAEAREAEQHQGPRGWFGNRLDHTTDDKGAKPIDRQINVGPEVGTQIDDLIIYRASGENLGSVDDNAKIETVDDAKEQITLKTKIERRAHSARAKLTGGPENLVLRS